MPLLERHQRLRDGVPRVLPARDDEVPAHLGVNTPFASGVQDSVSARTLVRVGGLEHSWIPDRDVRRQPSDDEGAVQGRQAVGRHGRVGIDEDFDPLAEPCGVELLVSARTRGCPEVEIEYGRQLFRGGQRKQLP